jgi:hypothetical protein
VTLALHLEGHETVTERFVPDVDQRLRLTLTPTEATEATETSAASAEGAFEEEATPATTTRRRPRMRGMTTEMAATGRDFRRWD